MEIADVKKTIILLMFCLMPFSGMFAKNLKVSLLTCSPGDEAYSLFGHTALRFCDNDRGTDIVFGYGYFDFSAPNFAWRFILGETDYMVGAVPYAHFINEYEERGSAVIEQEISLTSQQKLELYGILAENCRPENRVYRYNYFYNNCTTKIRDLLYSVVGDVIYKDEHPGNITFRDALSELTAEHEWYAFGIDLLLGADIDKPASRHQLQFIPGFFMYDADSAYIVSSDGTICPFVQGKSMLLEEQRAVAVYNHFTPFNASILLLLATLIIMLCEVRRKKTYLWFDAILMLLQGIPGLLLLFMALFSLHPAVGNNWLIILLNPVALLLLPIIIYRTIKGKEMGICWVQVFFVALFLLTAIFSVQVYPVPIYFCAVALLARALFHIYKNRICELNLL
mgnify:CR=1 FL=1